VRQAWNELSADLKEWYNLFHTMNSKIQKLYCYVDETGQDTTGELFLVSVVITEQNAEEMEKILLAIEERSGKGEYKWVRADFKRQFAYISEVVDNPVFKDNIYFSHYKNSKKYKDLTIQAAAKAILGRAEGNYEATILIDALGKSERYSVAAGLRRLRVKVKKVRGLSDQASALIRLADAVAGFARACLEGHKKFLPLYEKARRRGIIKEV